MHALSRFSQRKGCRNFSTASTSSASSTPKVPLQGSQASSGAKKTLNQIFDEKVAEYEHKDVFRHVPSNVRWTYFELQKEAVGFGNGLVFSKTRNQSKITALLNNELEALIVHLGAVKAGVVSSFAPAGLTPAAIHNILKSVEPAGLIFNTKTTKVKDLDSLIPEMKYFNGTTSKPWQYPFLKYIWHSNRAQYNGMDWMRIYQMTNPVPDLLPWNPPTCSASDVVTSSIDSNASQSSLTHEQVVSLATEIGNKLGLILTDRVCIGPSLSSLAGQVAGFWAPFQFGAVSVVPSLSFQVDDVVRAILVEKCTIFVGSQDQVDQVVNHPKIRGQSSPLQKALSVSQDAKPLQLVTL